MPSNSFNIIGDFLDSLDLILIFTCETTGSASIKTRALFTVMDITNETSNNS